MTVRDDAIAAGAEAVNGEEATTTSGYYSASYRVDADHARDIAAAVVDAVIPILTQQSKDRERAELIAQACAATGLTRSEYRAKYGHKMSTARALIDASGIIRADERERMADLARKVQGGGIRDYEAELRERLREAWREEGHAVMFNHAGDDLTPAQRVGKWLGGESDG